MVKQMSLKKAALTVAAAAALGASAQVSAQGVDTLESKLYPNYVTDDMLLNADKDHSNWLHYGKDYESTRYSAPQADQQGQRQEAAARCGTCRSACWKDRTARRMWSMA